MLHFGMNMPFTLMAFYGSLMIVIVLFLRALLKNKLPKFVFPILWCVVLLRLLVPFSLSSPLSVKVPDELLSYLSSNIIVAWNGLSVISASQVQEPNLAIGADIAVNADDIVETTIEQNTIVTAGTAETVAIPSYGRHAGTTLNSFLRRIPLPTLYVLGLLITVGILLCQKYRYSVKLKNRLLIEHNETINGILREVNMGHILVFSNDEIASPLVCGLFAPRIYLPTRMDFGNTELLRHILTHETMHIKRRDNWVKAVMLAALCLHWFNPLVWLMSKFLASDLEAACDEAVLRQYHNEEARKSYAFSLLAMAITGNRGTLLYSAFSKTEVERRIQNILRYKKTSVLLLTAAVMFLTSSIVLFSAGMQAPFISSLTSYCASAYSRWGVRVSLTRDIALGKQPQKRAEDIVFDVLRADVNNDPQLLEAQMRDALSDEFHVEKSAFRFDFSLCLDEEEREKEYAAWELTQDKNGFFLYKNEPVRVFIDETGGFYQSREEGDVDITIKRNRYGEINDVTALHEGDSEFDRRSRETERNKIFRSAYGSSENTAVQTTVLTEDWKNDYHY